MTHTGKMVREEPGVTHLSGGPGAVFVDEGLTQGPNNNTINLLGMGFKSVPFQQCPNLK